MMDQRTPVCIIAEFYQPKNGRIMRHASNYGIKIEKVGKGLRLLYELQRKPKFFNKTK